MYTTVKTCFRKNVNNSFLDGTATSSSWETKCSDNNR